MATNNLTDEAFAEMVEAENSPAAKRLAELERQNASLLAYVQALEEVCDSDQLVRAQSSAPGCAEPDVRDLRTREGRRREILEQIKERGGFSIFWVTENLLRACVAQQMQDRGEIITDNKTHGFPWIGARIAKQNAQGMP